MPELPEVEFARRLVSRRLLNNELSEITLGVHANTSDRDELPRLESCQGHPLLGVLRHGKQLYLSFGVSGISFHLGMTGKLQVLAPSDVEPTHVRLKLHFQDRMLVFRDTRKIGQVRALSRGGWREYLTEKRIGPDFFAETQDLDLISPKVLRGRRTIKAQLLDQHWYAGIGNIYACEGLFRARISPFELGQNLSQEQLILLLRKIRASMDLTLEREQGDEIRYLSQSETENPFLVYGKQGCACPNCGQAIERVEQHGRPTFFCYTCQSVSQKVRR